VKTPASPRLAKIALAATLCALSVGCPKKDEVIVESASGQELTADDIDRDPLALLPSGMVGLAHVDLPRIWSSPFGQKLLGLARARSPVPPSAGFDPARDLQRMYVGFYSMQGADVAAVAQGTFDRNKIEAAAAGVEKTPIGIPIVKSSYAGRSLFTAANVGFVVLTNRTVLFGNEIGIRRALDRIEEGRVERRVPEWMVRLIETPNAPLVGGADFRVQPLTDAIRQDLPFFKGVETARVLGNFEAPGMNFAGTLSYADDATAQQGAASLQELHRTLQNYGWVMALFGIAQPVKKLEARASGKEAQFVIGVDGQAVGQLLDKVGEMLGPT
jgi:hypothetical protein